MSNCPPQSKALIDKMHKHHVAARKAIYRWGQLVNKNGKTGCDLYARYLRHCDAADAAREALAKSPTP